MMNQPDPFATLGIAPTQSMAAVKQAYFAALARHPPQKDPEGFQRLRRAYEELTRPGGLRAAFMNTPVDVPAELARYAARLQAQREAGAPPEPPPDGARFLDTVFGMDLETAIQRFSR